MESSRWKEASMPSQHYRYYCLDGAGHLHDAEWFEADNDNHAIARIEAMHPDATCEVWQGDRLIAKLSPRRRLA